MKRFFKRAIMLLALAVVIGAFVYAFRLQPVLVDLGAVERGPMQVTIDEEGETRIHDRFIVSAPVSGRVQRIDLEPGDPVEAGSTIIARLLPAEPVPLDARARTEAEARVRQAEAALGRAIANQSRIAEELAFAEDQLDRYSELLEQGLVSRESFETVRVEARSLTEAMNTTEFEIRNAERAVEVAQAALLEANQTTTTGEIVTIRAPITGVVLRRIRESEAVVPTGEPLVEIGDLTDIEIVSDLLSADAVRVGSGSRVLIEEWGGGMTLEGRVRRVEPSGFMKLSALGVEDQRVNVVIDFVDRETAARYLGDGYRVEVRIVTWETEDALKVPTGSLFRTGDAWSVFVVTEGRAELRTVDIGSRNGLEAEVVSGLVPGDRVIMHPSDTVAHGVEVAERGV
jgi:HlyD family secretion protein